MSKANAWIAAVLVTGSLCVAAAVVKHVNAPPPVLHDVTPPPIATGDPDPADFKAWDNLGKLIDAEQCDQESLRALATQTQWNHVLQDDHIRTDADIDAGRAAIAEYRKIGIDILADQRKRVRQGESIIELMKDGSRSRTMTRFVAIESDLAANELMRQDAQKGQLGTVDQLLDLAQIRERQGKATDADSAKWNSLVGTLRQQGVTVSETFQVTMINTHHQYDLLGRFVGRLTNYSSGGIILHQPACELQTIHADGLADVERQVQQILSQ